MYMYYKLYICIYKLIHLYIQTPEGVLLPRYVNVDDKCIKVGLLNASIGLFIY